MRHRRSLRLLTGVVLGDKAEPAEAALQAPRLTKHERECSASELREEYKPKTVSRGRTKEAAVFYSTRQPASALSTDDGTETSRCKRFHGKLFQRSTIWRSTRAHVAKLDAESTLCSARGVG